MKKWISKRWPYIHGSILLVKGEWGNVWRLESSDLKRNMLLLSRRKVVPGRQHPGAVRAVNNSNVILGGESLTLFYNILCLSILLYSISHFPAKMFSNKGHQQEDWLLLQTSCSSYLCLSCRRVGFWIIRIERVIKWKTILYGGVLRMFWWVWQPEGKELLCSLVIQCSIFLAV